MFTVTRRRLQKAWCPARVRCTRMEALNRHPGVGSAVDARARFFEHCPHRGRREDHARIWKSSATLVRNWKGQLRPLERAYQENYVCMLLWRVKIAPFGTRTRNCFSLVRRSAGLSIPGGDPDCMSCSVFICALRSLYSALISIPLHSFDRWLLLEPGFSYKSIFFLCGMNRKMRRNPKSFRWKEYPCKTYKGIFWHIWTFRAYFKRYGIF